MKLAKYKKWFRFRMYYLMYQDALSDEDDSGEDDVNVLVTALYN